MMQTKMFTGSLVFANKSCKQRLIHFVYFCSYTESHHESYFEEDLLDGEGTNKSNCCTMCNDDDHHT
jgi:hypothetical protein